MKVKLPFLCSILFLFNASIGLGQVITTYAGSETPGFSGFGGLATLAKLGELYGVAVDNTGNVYAADIDDNVIWKVSPAGIISILGGSGTQGYSGDGGPATAAQLNEPCYIGSDPAGNVYFTDQKGVYIRKINTAGIISTVAGNITQHYSGGDGGPFSAATFYSITGVVVDNAGNIYISDNNTVRKVNNAGIINTIAGTGPPGYSGDGGPATAAELNQPGSVAVDNAGNVYIPDAGNNVVRKISTTGIISTIAGTGVSGYSGNGGPAVNAQLGDPFGIVVDNAGNIYIDEEGNYVIRKIDNTGIISDYAGNHIGGYSGDGGPANLAEITFPLGIAMDNTGNLYIADLYNWAIRKVSNCLVAQISLQPVNDAVCVNGNASFNLTATGVGSYQWEVNTGSGWAGLSDGGAYSGTASNTLAVSPVSGSMNGYQYRCSVGNACAAYPTVAAILTVNTSAAPTVTIAAPVASICSGTPVTFTASPGNGGTAPSYQWQLNGSNTGTNSPSYTNNTLTGGDIVSCVMTSNVSCVASPTAVSNNLSLVVDPVLTPALSIASPAPEICAGATVSFAASPTNGGTAPSYQWQLNGNNTGTNSSSYSSNSLVNGDVVSCIMTSNAVCLSVASVASNNLTLSVNPVLTPAINIMASAPTICAGTAVLFSANATNGGAAPSYQWQLNGSNTGTNSSSYSNSGLSTGDVVSCVLTSDATCTTSPTAVSNSLATTVEAVLTPAVDIAASATSICAGAPVIFTASPTNGGASPSYQWQVNGISAGSNNPSYTDAALVNGDIVQCIMTSDANCTTNPSANSNVVVEQVNADVSAAVSIATPATTICSGTEVSFTAMPTNGGNDPSFQWALNGAPTGGSHATFTTAALADGDVVSCLMTSSLSCSSPVSSETITMKVDPVPTLSLPPDTIIAFGQSMVLDATVSVSGGGSISSYQWSPATGLNNAAAPAPVAMPESSTTYQLTVESTEGCIASGKMTIGVFKEFQIPNAFTPNGDGKNDVFRIPPSIGVKITSFAVYNRWGTRVFMTSNVGVGWDGTLGGQKQPAGAYVWQIEYQDVLTGKMVRATGTVLLIR